jgi:hypothetical protein
MKRIIKTVVLITAMVSIPAQAEYQAYGNGTKSCATWTKDKADYPLLHGDYASWVSGYVTGFGFGTGLKLVADTNEMVGWIDDFCAANPRKNVYEAAEEMVYEIARINEAPVTK